MKIFLLLILFFAFALNTFCAPLIFKTTKEIKANGKDFVEIANFDVSKSKQIRVGVVWADWDNFNSHIIRIQGIEGEDIIHIDGFEIFPSKSLVIETPPSKIRISTSQSGTYKIYIWASQ